MTQIRVVFTGQGPSGLPEDRVINVWHFVGLLGYEADSSTAIAAVADFYNGANATRSVAEYISPWCSRDATLTTYDMTTPKPRIPTTVPLLLNAASSTGGLPEEVALCLSFAGVVPPAITARRRGRIYLGPLNLSAFNAADTTTPAQPSASFINDIRVAAVRLLVHATHQVVWSIMSSIPTQNFVEVGSGWIDNAFDTQRRRGPGASSRTSWPPAA